LSTQTLNRCRCVNYYWLMDGVKFELIKI
jgi:hypothetical protein